MYVSVGLCAIGGSRAKLAQEVERRKRWEDERRDMKRDGTKREKFRFHEQYERISGN